MPTQKQILNDRIQENEEFATASLHCLQNDTLSPTKSLVLFQVVVVALLKTGSNIIE